MQTISINDDGTTTIEFTGAEARALRDELAARVGNTTMHQLQRHLAMAHGEAQPSRATDRARHGN